MATIKKNNEKVAPKLNQATPFEPTPYEIKDICTSIALLSSPEKEIIIKALTIISMYANKSDGNINLLYKNGLMTPILELIQYDDSIVVKFALKLIGLLVTTIEDAANQFVDSSLQQHVALIENAFLTLPDKIVTEFSSQILGRILKSQTLLSLVFKTETITRIFDVLKKLEDADCHHNTLRFLHSLLDADEAPETFPSIIQNVSIGMLLCFLKHQITEIQAAAFDVVIKLIAWNNIAMQKIFKEEGVVELMLEILMEEKFRAFHTVAFEAIRMCASCAETASYFIRSLEFVTFCEWVKKCPGRYILPSVTVLETLTTLPDIRQVLFDFSFEDTLLSFFRIDDEEVFLKTCRALINMTAHRYCCEKVLTPIVVQLLLNALVRSDYKTIPYQEIALKALFYFMKRNGRAIDLIVSCDGMNIFTNCLLGRFDDFTEEGKAAIMEILFMFSTHPSYRNKIMNLNLYEMLINTFDFDDKLSQISLRIINQYIDNEDYRNHLIELNGPAKVVSKLTNTRSETLFTDILVLFKRLLLYKESSTQFLCGGALKLLLNVENDIKAAFPAVDEILNLMYNLHLPYKFHKLGRLGISDIAVDRFYLINNVWEKEFPFLEIILSKHENIRDVIYLVDFSADVVQLTQKCMKLPDTVVTESPKPRTRRRRSSLKESATGSRTSRTEQRPLTPKMSITSYDSVCSTIFYTSPPPINYGGPSADPYLPNYVGKLYRIIHEENNFNNQVKVMAKFVSDLLSGPDGVDDSNYDKMYSLHVSTLKEKLGTTIIPLGYMRIGKYCEKALLFKALADKVGIPATLERAKQIQGGELKFWNEVPLIVENYLAYAVVDLIFDVGHLYLVGSSEAQKYCGLHM